MSIEEDIYYNGQRGGRPIESEWTPYDTDPDFGPGRVAKYTPNYLPWYERLRGWQARADAREAQEQEARDQKAREALERASELAKFAEEIKADRGAASKRKKKAPKKPAIEVEIAGPPKFRTIEFGDEE